MDAFHARPFTRRNFLRTGATLLAGAALASSARLAFAGERTLRTSLSWIPNSQFSGLWMGLERGYFQQAGLTVDWRPGGPNTPNPVERVASREVDFGQQANPRPVIEAIAKGNDFVVIGSTFQRQPGGLLSLAANPIKTAADMVGKKIICPSPSDVRTVEVTLKVNKLPVEYTHVPGGFDPQALIDGQGDAMVAFRSSQPLVLERQGLVAEKDFFHRTWDELGQPGYNNLLFVRRDWLKDNRQLVIDYLKAESQGWADAEADPKLAAEIVTQKYGADLGLEQDVEERSLRALIPFLHSEMTDKHGRYWIDLDRLSGPIYEALRLGGLENLPEPSKFVDLSILEEVNAK